MTFGESNNDRRLKPSAWIDFDNSHGQVGQIVVWSSGECEISISKNNKIEIVDNNNLLSEEDLQSRLTNLIKLMSPS